MLNPADLMVDTIDERFHNRSFRSREGLHGWLSQTRFTNRESRI